MMQFTISEVDIDVAACRLAVDSPTAGGFACFEGWVRNHNEGRQVSSLEYEAYPALAIKEGKRILEEAKERFDIDLAYAVHRVGHLAIGDVAVWVGASAAHRAAAFDACRYIIDEIKHRVPVWKREHYAAGEAQWVNCATCAEAGHTHSASGDLAKRPGLDADGG